MLRRVLPLALAIACLGFTRPAQAEDRNISLPADAKFVVRLDLAALQKSKIGGPLFEQAKAEALDKIAKQEGGPTIDQIKEVVGFDPFQEIQSVIVAASDYQEPEHSLVAAVQLRQTTGNLEGLMLALPNYSTSAYGDYQVHSAKPDDLQEAHAAIFRAEDGDRTLVMAAQRDALEKMLDSLGGKSASESAARTARLSGEGDPILALQLFEFPEDMVEEEGPQANVAKIVSSVALQVAESDDNVNIRMQLASHSDQQAEQLKQMAQGLVAMVNLAAASDPEDEDAKLAQRLLQGVIVERSGAAVHVNLSLPASEVSKLIEEKMIEQQHGQ